jgi:hypothetical protein
MEKTAMNLAIKRRVIISKIRTKMGRMVIFSVRVKVTEKEKMSSSRKIKETITLNNFRQMKMCNQHHLSLLLFRDPLLQERHLSLDP